MKLSALMDFADDARNVYFESTMYKTMARLRRAGVSRVYLQYSGNRDYGYFWNHNAPTPRGTVETAKNMPEFSKTFVEAARKHDLEPVVVMRPQEQGQWVTFSPYYKESLEGPGIPYTGGKVMVASKFLLENPDLRIKRRTWDVDFNAKSRIVGAIRLRKQNAAHSRIRKEHITIYVSDTNSYYRKYDDDFQVEYSSEVATVDAVCSTFAVDYPTTTITKSGDEIEAIEITGLSIREPYIAIGVRCDGDADDELLFQNVPIRMISIFDKDGNEICASPGSTVRKTPTGAAHIEAGFNFDDGFGECWLVTLDPVEGEGFIAIAKGKDLYAHGALCECEPQVQAYWLEWVDRALDDGYDMIGTRIECHSVMVDEPYAYGYNDCVKQEYVRRHGICDEAEMELEKIAQIRGDAYTMLLVESAKRARSRGKMVFVTLNIDMLYDPIPLVRRCAYPMNVEWQWRRWLDEIKPDEINIRSYLRSIDFILNDRQCRGIIETARQYCLSLTLERYCYWDFAAEFETVRNTGIFSRMTLYETNNVIQSDGRGDIVEIEPALLDRLEVLTR